MDYRSFLRIEGSTTIDTIDTIEAIETIEAIKKAFHVWKPSCFI